MSDNRKQNLIWVMAWVSLGLYLSSKESVRFTALWRFDEKPLLLAVVIGLLYLLVFAGVMYVAKKRDIVIYEQRALIIVLAIFQTVGMTIHTLVSLGVTFSDEVRFVSYLGMEISLFLMLPVAQYIYTFDKKKILLGFAYGVLVAGSVQIILILFDVMVARWISTSLCLVSSILLLVSVMKNTKGATECQPTQILLEGSRKKPELINVKVIHSFKQFMWMIFLVSVVLMGAYSQWQSQQDGETASTLIQLTSGLGMVLAAIFLVITRRHLNPRSLFFLCQTIVLPITIGALYLGSIFEGPGISISVLLFDLSWSLILFSIWLAPLVYTNIRVVYVAAAGLLAHKMGWTVGISFTRSFPWQDYAWIGTIVIVLAFLFLVLLSVVSLVKSFRETDKALSVEPENEFENVCETIGERYALTKRENEVLLLLAKGRTAPYLARDLFLSESTVRTHIAHIYRKMDIGSQQELLDEVERTHKEIVQAKKNELPS